MRGAVAKIVEWARSQAAEFSIGFLLPLDMLRELPELWDTRMSTWQPTRLWRGIPCGTARRRADHQPPLQRAWDIKLTALEASASGVPSVLWLDRDDAAAIRRAVRASDDAYVAFTFVPEERPDPRTTAVMAAITAGARTSCGCRPRPPTATTCADTSARCVGPIKDFPATLRQRRAADPYMSGAFRVIWDRLDELPPYLERLGEELVSNG